MIKVLFVCHGNICRSPMAQSVMQYLVDKNKLTGQFFIDSAATSREEIGNEVHYGTRRKLSSEGIKVIEHKSRQLTVSDYDNFDYIIGMDKFNLTNMQRILNRTDKCSTLLSFAHSSNDIADPWYTGNFDATFNDVWRGCNALLEFLKEVKSCE